MFAMNRRDDLGIGWPTSPHHTKPSQSGNAPQNPPELAAPEPSAMIGGAW